MDASAYFKQEYLNRTPLAVRKCAKCEQTLGSEIKVTALKPAYACLRAKLSSHKCMQVYCHCCWNSLPMNINDEEQGVRRKRQRRQRPTVNYAVSNSPAPASRK